MTRNSHFPRPAETDIYVNDQLIQPKSQSIHAAEEMLQIYLDYSLSPNDLSDIETTE